MDKRVRGEIRVHQRADGLRTYSLRFRVNGKRRSMTLGTDGDGWNDQRAERKLEDVLAAVRAGVWQPAEQRTPQRPVTFHEFASRWWTTRKAEGLAPKTEQDYEWQLGKHLLPFFADYRVAEIDRELVDRYREGKLIEREQIKAAAAAGRPMRSRHGQRRRPLSNRSINTTLATLAQILEQAVDGGLLSSNPAVGKRRRLKTRKPPRRFLEADELRDLLAMAADVDRAARHYQIGRKPMIAVMAMAGLRVTEMCELRWRDVDVHHRRLVIRKAKTEAGVREVDLSLDLLEELISWRALQTNASPDELVFPTASGKQRDKDNVRKRLASVVKQTNRRRAERDLPALPTVSPHALRRTYISLLIEAGAPLPYVMRQVGHEDSRTTLEVYAQVQQRLSRSRIHEAFDDLLAGAGGLGEVPTERREKMSGAALTPNLSQVLQDKAESISDRVVRATGPRN
jgi:integrase